MLTFITDVFSELNLDDKILKDFNQARKQRKAPRKNQNSTSASKRTPTRVYPAEVTMGEILKSPLRKKKTSVQTSCKETQTDLAEPIDKLTNQNSKLSEEPLLLCQKPSCQSLLQKRTFSFYFNSDNQPKVMNLKEKGGAYNSNMIPCSGGPLHEPRPEGEAIDSILSMNGSILEPAPYKAQKTERGQVPSQPLFDASKGGPMDADNPLRMNRNVKKVSLPIQNEPLKPDPAKDKKSTSGIGAFGKPQPTNLLQAKRTVPGRNFRQTQFTTKRVKCSGYNNQNAVKSTLSITRPNMATHSILQEDSSQAAKHKGTVMNRLKNRAAMKNTQPSTDDVSH